VLQQVNFRRWWLQMSGGVDTQVNVNQQFTARFPGWRFELC
jgi:hypothetical protein